MIACNAIEPTPSRRTPVDAGPALVGDCPAMRGVHAAIDLVADDDVNVLVTGETGTGKELVARAVHDRGGRAAGPFLALNCAAIPEPLLESELFGHERGAFSGADRRRVGKFEQCDGGTLLLDEIGDMPLPLQAKVLRLLQDQSFERVGGNATIRTDVRLIASTHRDLPAMVARGQFRQDLYYRLSGFPVHLPPLRERGGDLDTLVGYFVRQHADRTGEAAPEVTSEAMGLLRRHDWPGNVRELGNVLRQTLLRSGGGTLTADHLPDLRPGSVARPTDQPGDFDVAGWLDRRLSPDAGDLYADLHRALDRVALRRVLAYTWGNQYLAAQLLGIARQTLRAKMRDAGVRVTSSVETRGAVIERETD